MTSYFIWPRLAARLASASDAVLCGLMPFGFVWCFLVGRLAAAANSPPHPNVPRFLTHPHFSLPIALRLQKHKRKQMYRLAAVLAAIGGVAANR